MTLGEFRELTKHYPDSLHLVTGEPNPFGEIQRPAGIFKIDPPQLMVLQDGAGFVYHSCADQNRPQDSLVLVLWLGMIKA